MSEKFRGFVHMTYVGGAQDVWSCSHKHNDIPAAAYCSQLHTRSMLPNTKDGKKYVRFETVTSGVEVHDPTLLGQPDNPQSQWIDLERYRKYFNPEI